MYDTALLFKSKNILYISEMWTFTPLLIHKVQYIYLLETKMWIETWLHDLIAVILTDHTIAKWEKRMYFQLQLTQYTSVSINAWERH